MDEWRVRKIPEGSKGVQICPSGETLEKHVIEIESSLLGKVGIQGC